MLQMTHAAAELLTQIRQSSDIPSDAGVRVYPEQATSDEVSIGLGFTEAPMPGDQVSEQEGMKLYVAPEIAGPLDTTMIDVTDDDGEARLIFCPQEQGNGTTAPTSS
jgi:Fe-S cluster assembly iron-binding protein IscA